MLKSSEHEILGRSSNYKSPIFKDCSEVRSADPQMSFYYKILRIGGPELQDTHWSYRIAQGKMF